MGGILGGIVAGSVVWLGLRKNRDIFYFVLSLADLARAFSQTTVELSIYRSFKMWLGTLRFVVWNEKLGT